MGTAVSLADQRLLPPEQRLHQGRQVIHVECLGAGNRRVLPILGAPVEVRRQCELGCQIVSETCTKFLCPLPSDKRKRSAGQRRSLGTLVITAPCSMKTAPAGVSPLVQSFEDQTKAEEAPGPLGNCRVGDYRLVLRFSNDVSNTVTKLSDVVRTVATGRTRGEAFEYRKTFGRRRTRVKVRRAAGTLRSCCRSRLFG